MKSFRVVRGLPFPPRSSSFSRSVAGKPPNLDRGLRDTTDPENDSNGESKRQEGVWVEFILVCLLTLWCQGVIVTLIR